MAATTRARPQQRGQAALTAQMGQAALGSTENLCGDPRERPLQGRLTSTFRAAAWGQEAGPSVSRGSLTLPAQGSHF